LLLRLPGNQGYLFREPHMSLGEVSSVLLSKRSGAACGSANVEFPFCVLVLCYTYLFIFPCRVSEMVHRIFLFLSFFYFYFSPFTRSLSLPISPSPALCSSPLPLPLSSPQNLSNQHCWARVGVRSGQKGPRRWREPRQNQTGWPWGVNPVCLSTSFDLGVRPVDDCY
jgi:hypothetical protein